VRQFVKHNGLSLFFLVIFVAALFFQALVGHADFNEDQDRHGDPRISLGRYVVSSQFGVAVMENWQSEYLQFTLFVLMTVWLLQRGSPESKELHSGRTRVRRRPKGRRARRAQFAALGQSRWPSADSVRELAAGGDGRHLDRHLVRPIDNRLDHLQQRAA
jgi:hypothetical protein